MRSSYWMWGLIGVAAVMMLVWELVPLQDASARMKAVPLNGFGYSSQNVEISEMEANVFRGCNLMKRYVQTKRGAFFITAVDGTGNRNAVHDPTLCFTGSGWEVAQREALMVPGGEAEIVSMVRGEETQEVLVFFTDGKQRFSHLVTYWLSTSIRRLTLGFSGEEPIRVIVHPLGPQGKKVNWTEFMLDYPPIWQL